MRCFVVFHRPGPAWQPGVDFREQPGVVDHVMHYRKLHDAAKLHAGGPFLDGTGGMMVAVPEMSGDEFAAFAADDPAVKSGLLVYEVHPWLIAMSRP